MPDKLRALINKRDRENARPHRLEPERLVLPDRGEGRARRICIGCRRDPDPQLHRENWLRANPMPPGCCPYWDREWHDDQTELSPCLARYIAKNLPPMTLCPQCGGELVEVTI